MYISDNMTALDYYGAKFLSKVVGDWLEGEKSELRERSKKMNQMFKTKEINRVTLSADEKITKEWIKCINYLIRRIQGLDF